MDKISNSVYCLDVYADVAKGYLPPFCPWCAEINDAVLTRSKNDQSTALINNPWDLRELFGKEGERYNDNFDNYLNITQFAVLSTTIMRVMVGRRRWG